MAKRQSFHAASGLFAPAPAPDPFFSPTDAQEVCTGSMHTKHAQEAGAAQEVQPPAPLDPAPDASAPLVRPQPAPPVLSPPRVDEAVPTRTTSGYGNTQGRKGKGLPRINMAFWPENYAWIKRQSSPYHTMTEIVNEIIDEYRRKSHGS